MSAHIHMHSGIDVTVTVFVIRILAHLAANRKQFDFTDDRKISLFIHISFYAYGGDME